jgi:hypothetical protein
MQLPRYNEHRIEKLMHLQVSHLGVMEDFIDIIHWLLDGPDPPGGIRHTHLHGFRFRVLLAPRVRKGSQELGPGGLLVDGPGSASGSCGSVMCWPHRNASRLGGGGELLCLRLGCLLSFWLLVLTWFRLLHDQHHAHGISYCRDVKQHRLTRFWSYHDWW